ncbi:MAG TPA: NADH-quinone oxidoreductase subunit NuoG [Burkholderiales bacterium]|nr:NADH-quinone oxidoreductase subunit NuoG [Burkholderiales bacterium]
MATVHIDNVPHTVNEDGNLLQECLTLGFDLPYFCWHPAMGSVGACRQCAIKQFKDEKDTKGRIVMACMTAAKDGTRISIDDAEAREFRRSVGEWLMINHPHDCPVCDEGGECHLQDMTVMTGHVYRRYRGLKRTFRNQDLGPFINHEMNRCIQCYRCTRFYREYAGGRDFDALMLRNHVYFGRYEDGTLENEFSGNLVEICPTGVFTDKSLKQHYTRKWDLQTAPSICVHCGLGCNTIPGERYGMLRRIRNRYNGAVNGYFLCDRGRYGYEFVNGEHRIRQPLLRQRRGGALQTASRQQALDRLAPLFRDSARVIGIGSARASLEANFALRTLVGAENFYLGMTERDHALLKMVLDVMRNGPARIPSLHDAERSDAVLVLGEDVTQTAPRLALALRQSVRRAPWDRIGGKLHIPQWDDGAMRAAVQSERGPLFIATAADTRLDDVATQVFHAAPDDIARLGHAIAHELDGSAPAATDLPDNSRALAATIAGALKAAKHPLIVAGVSYGSHAVIEAAANAARALHAATQRVQLCLIVPECNSIGTALLGGRNLDAALDALNTGDADTVVVLESDLYRSADRARIDACLAAARHVVIIDHTMTATGAKADVVLPGASFAERDGTLVNNEGRAQRMFQVFVPHGDVQESWRWLRDIMHAAGRGRECEWSNLDQVTAACAAAIPQLGLIVQAAPPADFRIAGQKIPRAPHRYSGRTAILANIDVSEPQPPPDPDSALAFTMEGYSGEPPAALIPRFWAPGWNSVQSLNKFQQEVGGPLAGGDPGVRLIEPGDGTQGGYFGDMPAAFEAHFGEWLLLPLHQIFGSEEMSAWSPAIMQRIPARFVALHPADAVALGCGTGDVVELQIAGVVLRLPLQLRPDIARGVAGVPAALPPLAGVALPTRAVIRPAKGGAG